MLLVMNGVAATLALFALPTMALQRLMDGTLIGGTQLTVSPVRGMQIFRVVTPIQRPTSVGTAAFSQDKR